MTEQIKPDTPNIYVDAEWGDVLIKTIRAKCPMCSVHTSAVIFKEIGTKSFLINPGNISACPHFRGINVDKSLIVFGEVPDVKSEVEEAIEHVYADEDEEEVIERIEKKVDAVLSDEDEGEELEVLDREVPDGE